MSDSTLVTDAVRPTARDLLEVRALVIEALRESSSLAMSDLEEVIYRAREIEAPAGSDYVRVEGHSHLNATGIDSDSPILHRKRLHFALREVLATLTAEGALIAASGDHYGKTQDSVPAAGASWRGSVSFAHDYAPAPQGRMKLNSTPAHRLELIDSSLVDELRELLGPRGFEVLNEGIRCYHRGLFIAAVDLLAAASEAAWFTLATLFPKDEKLSQHAAAGTNAAEVISRTRDALGRDKIATRHTLTDLHAQAAHLRDLRNYGVHPVGSPDQDREPAFTEAGCAVLYMSAPRYFRQLDTLRHALLGRMQGDINRSR
jgi:hypothetical protein